MKNFWIEARTPDGPLKGGGKEITLDVYQLSGGRSHKTVKVRAVEDEPGFLSLSVTIENLDGEISFNNVVSIKGVKSD